jgi:hypothetical protein
VAFGNENILFSRNWVPKFENLNLFSIMLDALDILATTNAM